MRKIIFVVIMLVFWTGAVYAERIYLVNGDVLDGKVIGRGSVSTMVRVDGQMRRVENTDIDRIEKDPPQMDAESADDQNEVAVTTTVDSGTEDVYNGPEIADEAMPETTAGPDTAGFDGMTTRRLVLQLFKVNGTQENLRKNMDAILSKLTSEQRERMESTIKLEEIVEALIPVYEKSFTAGELQGLILFYESDLGKKMVQMTPKISEEVVKATVNYFSQKFKKNDGL